ncbi:hypothetical protein RSOLAG22IIIB_10471 [Rhizoctonia solani]|uniref:Uncharacterized protein n=1 Tax=Rhizoctonia solani TaxID=456999 RepID=A0A0K6G3S3_9AGAM|nr:hypothetical protein RSOLAG22IIIB_10471 [Rhizoctonia solani]
MEVEPTTVPVPAPASPPAGDEDEPTQVRRESKRLRDKAPSTSSSTSAPVLVNLPPHPPSTTPLHFSTKHYPASAHGERRQQHTHFARLPPDHAPGPLPEGTSASFSYRGPPQPPVPGAAPAPPPPGGTPLILDRERPPPPPELEYSSQQAVLANMLSQRIDQVDQLRTQLAHAEARIASLSARSNPSAALAQAESRAEQAEARLAAIKEAWRGVESYLDMLARREAEARAAFIRTLGTGEIGVPPSVPMFGAGPTSPYLPVRPPVPPNVPTRATTFPALPPAPVPGGNSVIWRHESGRRRPAEDTDESPNKRPRGERDKRGRDREREREVRKEKARFSDSPSPPPSKKEKEADLSPPIASITDKDADPDAEGDADEEVDQIVDDVEMAPPKKPSTNASANTNTTATATTATTTDDADKDAEGSPETDTDLSVDEELLKLSSKAKKPRRDREYAEVDREFARTDYSGYPPDYPRYHPWAYDGYYHPDEYREPIPRGYPPPAPRAEFAQRNGSAPTPTSAPWYAHLKPTGATNTNTQGQRTCRQCGLPGRYKDGKCVEKWGPGPEGPGTVCDRCRKKMKRVERRGTADASVLAQGLAMHHPAAAPQSQPQSQSQSQLSQTQLGTQYSPQRWQNGNGAANGEAKRYDAVPKDFARREGSVDGTKSSSKKEVAVVQESEKDAEGEVA